MRVGFFFRKHRSRFFGAVPERGAHGAHAAGQELAAQCSHCARLQGLLLRGRRRGRNIQQGESITGTPMYTTIVLAQSFSPSDPGSPSAAPAGLPVRDHVPLLLGGDAPGAGHDGDGRNRGRRHPRTAQHLRLAAEAKGALWLPGRDRFSNLIFFL